LPRLAGTSLKGRLFFEARPTVTREDVARIAALGCRVQFGIESFSDNALELMRKGTSALENIRLLKWCRSLGVRPVWNLLYGIPGETTDDLAEILRLLPSLRFLQPPRHCGSISLDRFSSYFEEADGYGLRNVRPVPSYACVYPLPHAALQGLAYSFDFEREESRAVAAYHFRIRREVERWRREQNAGEPRQVVADDGMLAILDSRPGAAAEVRVLDPLERLIVEECDDICTREGLVATAARQAGVGVSTAAVDERLRRLEEQRMLVSIGDRYLGLALPPVDGASVSSTAATSATADPAPSRAKIS
jgi:Radical SAM superfamily